MADFGGEVMAEVLAQRALEKPVIPLIPITNSNQYRHTEHDRDYKIKVHMLISLFVWPSGLLLMPKTYLQVHTSTQVLCFILEYCVLFWYSLISISVHSCFCSQVQQK